MYKLLSSSLKQLGIEKKIQLLTNGQEYGIFTEWTECSPHVTGVKGSLFQGCKTIETAKTILESSSLTTVTKYDNGKWMSPKTTT